MEYRKDFKSALINKTIPNLTLDQKWHRLFAIHGKPDEVKELENKITGLLATEARLNQRLKELKKLKSQLLNNIVQNMDNAKDGEALALREKKQEENKRLVDEANQKIDECEDELADIPFQIREANEELMLRSMDYFYEKLRVNRAESLEIEEWINQVRVDLKKNIIRKQNRDINNREIYEYLHDIFGASVIDIFDIKYDDESGEKN
ncbi:MAG: hypothetical protein E7283_01550 [Lachnospiraceae bacterium]|nr:hypothetical protein [Lachnospiraceae bacterium]